MKYIIVSLIFFLGYWLGSFREDVKFFDDPRVRHLRYAYEESVSYTNSLERFYYKHIHCWNDTEMVEFQSRKEKSNEFIDNFMKGIEK